MERPPVAHRIRTARENAGLTREVVAKRVGLSLASYYDLEAQDDEAFMCISLGTLIVLAHTLGVSARALVGDENALVNESVAYDRLAAQVRAQIGVEGMTPETWSEKVGWDVSDLLANPARVADLNLDGLHDICFAVGADWLAVVANEAAVPTG